MVVVLLYRYLLLRSLAYGADILSSIKLFVIFRLRTQDQRYVCPFHPLLPLALARVGAQEGVHLFRGRFGHCQAGAPFRAMARDLENLSRVHQPQCHLSVWLLPTITVAGHAGQAFAPYGPLPPRGAGESNL